MPTQKVGEIVFVADAETLVDDSLVQIWRLKFVHKTNFFVETLSTRFGQDFEIEVQARFKAGVWSVFR